MDCNFSTNDLTQLQLLEAFPLILPQNNDFSRYDGFIVVGERQFHVTVDVPNYPSAHGVKLILNWELEVILAGFMTVVSELSNECMSVLDYLTKLQAILESCVSVQNINMACQGIQVKNASSQFKTLSKDDLILSHLRSVGFNHVSSVGAEFNTVSLIASDRLDNAHEISFKLSQSYPDTTTSEPVLSVINTDLPKAICEIMQKECNIPAAYDCFSQQLHNLSSVWKELELLDSKAWVIDPTHPKKSDMYRRILIDAPKVMAQITWNPLRPHSKPDIMFQGAETEVERFRNVYESHIEEWSNSCDVLANLCRVLNLTGLPAKESSSDNNNVVQENGDCCICMCAELNGVLPSITCGQCLSSFHALCLFQWLEMLGSSRVIHNHITGACPNCEGDIKCPDPSAMDTP